jgi:hypothetical protein
LKLSPIYKMFLMQKKWKELDQKLMKVWKMPQFKSTFKSSYEKHLENKTPQEAEKERLEREKSQKK